jgi:hypothetical protein
MFLQHAQKQGAKSVSAGGVLPQQVWVCRIALGVLHSSDAYFSSKPA